MSFLQTSSQMGHNPDDVSLVRCSENSKTDSFNYWHQNEFEQLQKVQSRKTNVSPETSGAETSPPMSSEGTAPRSTSSRQTGRHKDGWMDGCRRAGRRSCRPSCGSRAFSEEGNWKMSGERERPLMFSSGALHRHAIEWLCPASAREPTGRKKWQLRGRVMELALFKSHLVASSSAPNERADE